MAACPRCPRKAGAGRGAAPGASSSGWPSWCSCSPWRRSAPSRFPTGRASTAYDSLAEEAFDAPEDVAGTSLADLTVDWDALRAINPDVVGWIYVPGTKVNYPIMHSGDDETYLTRDFYGNEGGWWMADYGAVFLSGGNRPDFTDTNNIVYGHNLLNGSMFADIAGHGRRVRRSTAIGPSTCSLRKGTTG